MSTYIIMCIFNLTSRKQQLLLESVSYSQTDELGERKDYHC